MSKKNLILRPPFDQAWKNKDPFVEMESLGGESYRNVKTRDTSRFDFQGKSYFIKRHYGTTLGEVLKNLLTLKMPVLGADCEWNAIHHLESVGVDSMKGVAFGQQGWNPLKRKSFIITEDLSPVMQLDHFFLSKDAKKISYEQRLAIIERVAQMVRKMHLSGLNHRDCYLCHFLLRVPFTDVANMKIFLIDLHRAQIRRSVPRRWRDKDLIALYYSTLDLGFSQKEVFRFMKIYFGLSLRDIFQMEDELLRKVKKKVAKIHSHTLKLGDKP